MRRGASNLKDVKYEGRSGNVYENKGSNDKMPEQLADICAQLRPFLQKNSVLEGQFAINFPFQTQLGQFQKAAAKLNSL